MKKIEKITFTLLIIGLFIATLAIPMMFVDVRQANLLAIIGGLTAITGLIISSLVICLWLKEELRRTKKKNGETKVS